MTKKDLVEMLQARVGLPASHIAPIVETILELTKEALERGEPVKISGFGQFTAKEKAERLGRNPRTGERMIIPAHKVLTFKPSKLLKNKINHET